MLCLLVLILIVTAAAAAEPSMVSGSASVIDGDTFAIGETTIRLADVDAPELAQKCDGGPADLRSCGAYVADALAERIGGRAVRCAVVDVDQYDRRIARCEVAGADLSRWLVSSGLAMAFREYSERFVGDEEAARSAQLGLWQADFEPPWGISGAPPGCRRSASA